MRKIVLKKSHAKCGGKTISFFLILRYLEKAANLESQGLTR